MMAALSNILGLPPFILPLGVANIHFIQLPIILSGLLLGAFAGGLVGLIGAATMALTLPVPNFYLLPGNAILGFSTGLLHTFLAKRKRRPIVSHMVSAFVAYLVQAPYVYVTDLYLMRMPQPVVVAIIFTLLAEDLICAFLSHIILYRVNIPGSVQ
jgi:LytS/YehU family sensor histidine kinase